MSNLRAGEYRKASKSPWCEVRGSDIHGRGVFATRDIPKGKPIIEYVGEVITKREAGKRGRALLEESRTTGGASVYIFILDGRHDLDGNFPWNEARLINHSCEPNCETEIDEERRIWVTALHDIKKGDELFFDYNFDLESFEDHPCRCGSPECVGYIVGQDYWEKLKRLIARREKARLTEAEKANSAITGAL
ncbi:MAG: SET domain-containing protein [Verrucomicrobiales bacterium]